MPQKTRKRRRTGDPEARWLDGRPHAAPYDQTGDGRMLRLLNIVDEFTRREALVMQVERSITAEQTVAALQRLVAARLPGERPLRQRPRANRPGAPWQNPFAESFNARVRNELLNLEEFSCLAEAQILTEDWRQDYNREHPHSALGMKSPAAFAATWTPVAA